MLVLLFCKYSQTKFPILKTKPCKVKKKKKKSSVEHKSYAEFEECG